MKKIFLLCWLLLCLPFTPLLAQQTPYVTLRQQAYDAYKQKEYKKSGKLFDQAIKKGQPTGTTLYDAACSWALAGDATRAFRYLDKAADAGWENVAHLKQDTDLRSLRGDARWQSLLDKFGKLVAKKEASYDQPLKQELEGIYQTDQGVRSKIDSVQKNFGPKSLEWKALMDEMKAVDERNTKRVTAILDERGYPSPKLVGSTASLTAFLVIQHSDLAVQEKYLPLLRQATQRGELAPSSLALLEDRILTRRDKPQRYGSQVRTDPATGKMGFFPIEDEAHVDERRAAIGLEPLADYAKRFGFEYQPEQK